MLHGFVLGSIQLSAIRRILPKVVLLIKRLLIDWQLSTTFSILISLLEKCKIPVLYEIGRHFRMKVLNKIVIETQMSSMMNLDGGLVSYTQNVPIIPVEERKHLLS